MKGSEKQIAWAEKIKIEWLEHMNYLHNSIMQREQQSPGDLPTSYYDSARSIYAKLKSMLDAKDDAKWIIDAYQAKGAKWLGGAYHEQTQKIKI